MAGTGVERVRRGPRAPPLVKRADLRRRGSAGAGHGRNPAGLHGDHRDAAAAPHWGVAARAELSPVLGGRLRWRMGMVVVVPTEPDRASAFPAPCRAPASGMKEPDDLARSLPRAG